MRNRRSQPQAPAVLPAGDDLTLRELVLLAIVLAAGAAARVVALGRSAVEHFDEGVYASNIYFGPPEFAYPQQRFYAPPLLPALIELGMIAGLPPNLAALLPSFLAGCATIVALWWLGRSWFGPEVGLSGAALVALNDFHITLSATALTDVLLGLWLLLAVDAIGRSLLRADYRWAVGAGIYIGLAWWTKYNGWLPLAIEGASLPVLWFFLRPPRRELLAWLGCFAVTALVAAAVWSPFFLSLQSAGGYGPIAANHAKYVVGLGGSLDSAARQIANQYVFDSPLSSLGVALGLALPGLLARRNVWQRIWRDGASIGVGVLVFFWSSLLVVGIGALLGLVRMAIAIRQSPLDGALRRQAVGLSLVAAWWVGLLVATPCYTPYPRLVLPWLLAACLGMALNCSDLLYADDARPVAWAGLRRKRMLGYAAIVLIFLVTWLFFPLGAPIGRFDRRGLVRIAEQVRATDIRRQPRVIYVYGEPAIFFQLKAAGEPIVSAIQTVPSEPATSDDKPVPTFLIAGPHAQRDPQFQEQWSAVKYRWELLHEYDYQPSPVVWLDLNDPRESSQATHDLDRVRLYRLREMPWVKDEG